MTDAAVIRYGSGAEGRSSRESSMRKSSMAKRGRGGMAFRGVTDMISDTLGNTKAGVKS